MIAAMQSIDVGRLSPAILGGKYRLVSVLAEGGMGTVWRAEHLALGTPVAVKLIDPALAGGADALRLCEKEARAAAAVLSPHVVQVLDFGRDETTGGGFVVMELLEGETLADRLRRVGRLQPGVVGQLLTHVAHGLGRAHDAGIVHRDLKPANVFLARDQDEELAKILDFGVARFERDDTLARVVTATGAVIGTPYYMSPEQISAEPVDHRTDLWAMAVMAFECVTGQRPFAAGAIGPLVLQICIHPIPIPSQVTRVPAGFDGWFERATQRDPNLRFQSARELADELWRVCAGGAIATARGAP
jgi:eukaryotic-like serine/threonine-protein kinase